MQDFELQPVLRGNRIVLRPLRSDDFEALFACASDPLIWAQHPVPNRYQEPVFRKFFDGAVESGGAFTVLDGDKVVGSSRYYNLMPRQVTIGYTFLARSHWGGSTNAEMKRLMLEHAFRFVDEARFEIGATNFRSRRAIEKIGAKLLEECVLDGKPYVVYAIKRPWSATV